jgi:hypothetical protein
VCRFRSEKVQRVGLVANSDEMRGIYVAEGTKGVFLKSGKVEILKIHHCSPESYDEAPMSAMQNWILVYIWKGFIDRFERNSWPLGQLTNQMSFGYRDKDPECWMGHSRGPLRRRRES